MDYLRALVGSFLTVGTMVFCVFIVYKCAVCQQGEKDRNIISVKSKEVTNI